MWPSAGCFLIPGINDTWNDFQKFNKGKIVSSDEWRSARAELRKEYQAHIEGGGETLQLYPFSTNAANRSGVLSNQQVLEIYRYKILGKNRRLGAAVARIYGVTAKAIRDIWNRRTWRDMTCHMKVDGVDDDDRDSFDMSCRFPMSTKNARKRSSTAKTSFAYESACSNTAIFKGNNTFYPLEQSFGSACEYVPDWCHLNHFDGSGIQSRTQNRKRLILSIPVMKRTPRNTSWPTLYSSTEIHDILSQLPDAVLEVIESQIQSQSCSNIGFATRPLPRFSWPTSRELGTKPREDDSKGQFDFCPSEYHVASIFLSVYNLGAATCDLATSPKEQGQPASSSSLRTARGYIFIETEACPAEGLLIPMCKDDLMILILQQVALARPGRSKDQTEVRRLDGITAGETVIRMWTGNYPVRASLVAWSINDKGAVELRTVIAQSYDVAMATSPRSCPLALFGDRRLGSQLIEDFGSDLAAFSCGRTSVYIEEALDQTVSTRAKPNQPSRAKMIAAFLSLCHRADSRRSAQLNGQSTKQSAIHLTDSGAGSHVESTEIGRLTQAESIGNGHAAELYSVQHHARTHKFPLQQQLPPLLPFPRALCLPAQEATDSHSRPCQVLIEKSVSYDDFSLKDSLESSQNVIHCWSHNYTDSKQESRLAPLEPPDYIYLDPVGGQGEWDGFLVDAGLPS